MYKFVTGAASLLRHIHSQDGASSAPSTDNRKKSAKNPGLALMQTAFLLMGSLMVTSQASSQTYCHPAGMDNTTYNANVTTSPYQVGIFTSGITDQSANCLSYYGNTNYVIKWNVPQGKDILSGLGVPYTYDKVDIASASTNAKAYHHESYKGQSSGRNYFALYGRFATGTTANTDEWYIVDDWQGQLPPQDGPGLVYQGQITVLDEGTYNVYEAVITNSSGKHFQQWWSIRTSVRNNGWIHYINHFRAWQTGPLSQRTATLPADTLIGASFLIEANKFTGTGEVDVSSIDLTSYKP